MKADKILILGVTGSGKGRLAFGLAKEIGAEIISVDSMKVYRRMDIGTAKPPRSARDQVKYHLIDVVEPSESFSVAAFLDSANAAVEKIKADNKPVIAVGGTSLYIKALLYGLFEGPGTDKNIRAKLQEQAKTDGLGSLHKRLEAIDSAAAQRIHPNDSKRIIRALEVFELTGKPISSFQQQFSAEPADSDWTVVGLRRDKTLESNRINQRVKKMIEAGLVDEVRALLAEPEPLSKQAFCAIGYAEMNEYLNGKTTLEKAIENIKKNTRHLAKHQRTWFRSFKNVNPLDISEAQTQQQILSCLKDLLKSI